jgi:hypothetical protein
VYDAVTVQQGQARNSKTPTNQPLHVLRTKLTHTRYFIRPIISAHAQEKCSQIKCEIFRISRTAQPSGAATRTSVTKNANCIGFTTSIRYRQLPSAVPWGMSGWFSGAGGPPPPQPAFTPPTRSSIVTACTRTMSPLIFCFQSDGCWNSIYFRVGSPLHSIQYSKSKTRGDQQETLWMLNRSFPTLRKNPRNPNFR